MTGSRARGLAAGAGLGLLAACAAAQSPCGGFVGPDLVSVPGYPADVATADFDGDGIPDVAAVIQDGVAVALATPVGFQPARTFAVYVFVPAKLVAGDFDGDGNADVIVSSYGSGTYFLAGNGDGTLQPPVPTVNLGFAATVLAADVDGDGVLDLVALYQSSPSAVGSYRGHGDGTFDDPTYSQVEGFQDSLDLGDVNGDGRLDAVVSGYSGSSLVLLLGMADASFGAPTVIASGADQHGARIGDFDGDGRLDVVDGEGTSVAVRRGHGDGTFDPPIYSFAPPAPGRLYPVDLDGDGKLDLGVVHVFSGFSASAGLEILRGAGDGTFTPGAAYFTGGGSQVLVSLADYDGDGAVDALFGPPDLPGLWFLRGRGDGTLRGAPAAMFGTEVDHLITGDFDEDGRPDLAESGFDPLTGLSQVGVATAGADRVFTLRGAQPTPSLFVVDLAAGDFHGTGHLDLAAMVADYFNRSLALFPGQGDGTLGPAQVQPLPIPQAQRTWILAGRFDAGPTVDLAAVTSYQQDNNSSVTVLLGNGDGTFAAGPNTVLPLIPGAVASADLDGDGQLDLLLAGWSGAPTARLLVLYGRGDGTFDSSAPYPVGPYPGAIVLGDVNEDGIADVLVGDTEAGSFTLLFGRGARSYEPAWAIGAGGVFASASLADFNGDGHLDLLSSIGSPAKITLLLGLGDGTFAAPIGFLGTSGPLVAGDFDGDGFLDAASGGGFDSGAAILWNGHVASASVSAPPAIVGSAARLVATSLDPRTYQWRRGGVPLTDGGAISGSRTPILTIDPVSFADAASYDVVVSDGCESVTSAAAALAVEFADVPVSSPFHADIVAVATAGITGGCGGGNYCPTSPVRRDQMAVFLLKSEHGSSYVPPQCTGLFDDVSCPSPFADWIEQLATEGVTGGCGGNDYCPSASVTRAQMAVFLLKTSQGASYTPPAATGIFGDVPVGSFAADFIEDLYGRGITGGCQASPLLYCPGATVLRQQMATFLVRTFLAP